MVEIFIKNKGFLTDTASSNDTYDYSLLDNIEQIKIMIDEIDNAVSHLKRSNNEIQEYLKEENDSELKDVIEENIEAINIKLARREKLDARLTQLRPHCKAAEVTKP